MSRRTKATAAPAKPRPSAQQDTPVKAVREPADWNLEREPTKHRHSMDIAIVARAMPSSCIQAGTSV
jgi:hypothetical protein